MLHRFRLLLIAAAVVGLPLSLAAQMPAPLDTLRTLAGDEQVVSHPLGDFQVRYFRFGDDRQPIIDRITADGIWSIGGEYYVREGGSGAWLIGRLRPQDAGGVVECQARFRDLDTLVASAKFPPLPAAPQGLSLREVARMPDFPARLASDGRGEFLYVLAVTGDVFQVETATGRTERILVGDDYHQVSSLERQSLGLWLDGERRLHIASNERIMDARPIRNDVTVFRSLVRPRRWSAERPRKWLQHSYPWGIGAFNHGVNHMALGPDGMLYVSSGSRTDGNEPGKDPLYFQGGEVDTTACIWRLDPNAQRPKIEVYARGLRNAFGFCWSPSGQMVATDNGPDADAPEELNIIEEGRHYGFPFQFADWDRKPYPHTPDPPAGVTFAHPVVSTGPAAGGSVARPISTVDPHSSPGGIVYVDGAWPERYQQGYFFSRFGNLLGGSARSGYDLLFASITRRATGGGYQARIETVLAPLSRPVDIHLSGTGKLYILEYSRQQDNVGFSGNLPGRLLELSAPPMAPDL